MQPIHVLTNRYHESRIDVNRAETKLNVANVNRNKDGAAGTKHGRPGKAEPRPWLRLSCELASTSRSFAECGSPPRRRESLCP